MMRIRHVAATALVATAVLGATAACTSSSPGSGATTTATGAATTTAAGPGSTTGASETTPSGSGSTAAPGSSPNVAAAGSACTGSAIHVTTKSAGAATNHGGYVLIFTNSGRSACTLQGYPGVAVVKGTTTLLNATRSLTGFMFNPGGGISSAPLVTLAAGASASTLVEWVGNAGETCYATGTGALEVTPPNTQSTSSLTTLTLGDNGICADFETHPVVSGVLPYVNG